MIGLAACGSVASTGSSASHTAPQAKVSLTVQVTPSPGATPERWTLRCEPTGGTHPDPAAACRQLLAAKNPFAPIPRGIMCPMIVSGPQKATITGTFLGKPVDASFSRLDGCAAVRWSELGEVFTPHGAPVNGSPMH
ncbi:MAG TPA: SSI family serine proteinase inhibitor [Streptosporangiaceae bacterium]|nr:SSI family serine proteinase inhibitor [Streptosporangiaceae bacterium]